MAEKVTVRSVTKFMEEIEKGHSTFSGFQRSLYTFVRDYMINYFNGDKNTSLKEKFAEYKISDAFKGKRREEKKNEMINIEMDLDNISQIENTDGVEIATRINLLSDTPETAYEIDNDLIYKLFSSNSDKVKKDIVFEMVRDMSYILENWKISEEIKNGKIKYNSLSLEEIIEYSNASVREKAYSILGNGENIKNKIVRDAGNLSIVEATGNFLRSDSLVINKKLRGKKEDIVILEKQKDKEIRNGALVQSIEEMQYRKDEEISEKTKIYSNGYEYEISQEEEIIASYPEILSFYPALMYKFNEDGSRKTIVEEVNHGLQKINELETNYNKDTGNKEALDGKIKQVYDFINKDFVYQLSISKDRKKFMKGFISSIGIENSRDYLMQLESWQKDIENDNLNEKQEFENKIESQRKEIYINTDREKADDYLNEVGKYFMEKKKEILTIKYENIKKINPEISILVEDSISNIEEYKLEEAELENYNKEQKAMQNDIKNKAIKIYNDRKKQALEKDSKVEEREKEFANNIKQKDKEKPQNEQYRENNLENEYKKQDDDISKLSGNKKDKRKLNNEKRVSQEENNNKVKNNEADIKQEKTYPEEDILIEDEPMKSVFEKSGDGVLYKESVSSQNQNEDKLIDSNKERTNDFSQEAVESEDKRNITGYTTGNYNTKNDMFYDVEDGQKKIKMPDGSVSNKENIDVEYLESVGKFQSTIEGTFEEITEKNQMNMDEWKEEKAKIEREKENYTKEEKEYDELKSADEKVKYLEEHPELRKLLLKKYKQKYDKDNIESVLEHLKETVIEAKETLKKEKTVEEKVEKLYGEVKSLHDHVMSLKNRENKGEI